MGDSTQCGGVVMCVCGAQYTMCVCMGGACNMCGSLQRVSRYHGSMQCVWAGACTVRGCNMCLGTIGACNMCAGICNVCVGMHCVCRGMQMYGEGNAKGSVGYLAHSYHKMLEKSSFRKKGFLWLAV